jgi:hypothetical protein
LLLVFLFLRELLLWKRARLFPLSFVSVVLSIPILCVKIVPVQVAAGQPAKMLEFAGPPPDFDQSYLSLIRLQDAAGEMLGPTNMRAFPTPTGMRVLGLTHDFGGEVSWTSPPSGWTATTPPVRYGEAIGLGWPCWLKLPHCRLTTNDRLPPAP